MRSLYDFSGLEGLMLTAKQLAHGLYTGRHVSIYRGAGSQFHDYRPYCPGDNLGHMDWKLFGRTDRCHIRRFDQLTDQQVYLLIDCTASMNFAGLDHTGQPIDHPDQPKKYTHATVLAAVMAFLAIRQYDRVGLGLYAEQLTHHLPPGGTWAHLQQICTMLEKTRADAAGPAGIGPVLHQASAVLRRRSLVVVLSDLLDEPEPLFDGLNRLMHERFEVIVFQLLTRQELDLSGLGPALHPTVQDPETLRTTPTNLRQARHTYQQLLTDHIKTVRHGCLARGAKHQLVITDQSVITTLRDSLHPWMTIAANPG